MGNSDGCCLLRNGQIEDLVMTDSEACLIFDGDTCLGALGDRAGPFVSVAPLPFPPIRLPAVCFRSESSLREAELYELLSGVDGYEAAQDALASLGFTLCPAEYSRYFGHA